VNDENRIDSEVLSIARWLIGCVEQSLIYYNDIMITLSFGYDSKCDYQLNKPGYGLDQIWKKAY
jgi:hypothetical protein